MPLFFRWTRLSKSPSLRTHPTCSSPENYTLSSNTSSRHAGWLIENVNNLIISGGWNEDFTTQNVKSIIDATINALYVSMCDSIVLIDGCQYLSFTNFVLSNCANINGAGGGLYAANLDGCIIAVDSTINYATSGGGLYLCDSTGCTSTAIISVTTEATLREAVSVFRT
jgi:hypothetical protein